MRGIYPLLCHDAVCHSWFIVKDKSVPINWRKPLLQKSQITGVRLTIAENPFAEGAMRYAFLMKEEYALFP